jgi:hypothetical protein
MRRGCDGTLDVLQRKRGERCETCGDPVGLTGTHRFCAEHSTHRFRSAESMRLKRAVMPEYRELEREKVRERMRKLRARPDYERPD